MTDTISLQFRSDAPFQQIMDHGDNRMILLSFDAGQTLEDHQVPMVMSVLVLEGRVQFRAAGKSDTILTKGQLVVMQPNEAHALEAIEKSSILLILFTNANEDSVQEGGQEAALRTSVHMDPKLMENIAPELQSLVMDHNGLCEELEKSKDRNDFVLYKETLDLIGDELNHHFVFEETILFPRVANLLGGLDVGPIAMLLREHGKIRRLYASCVKELEAFNTDPYAQGNLKKRAKQLTNILLQHIEKEDKFIFPMASRILSKEDLQAIERELTGASKS